MALTTVMPVQVLAVGDIRTFPGRNGGAPSRVRNLQCFTGDVVGEIRQYLREGDPETLQAGHYNATIGWSNYQGTLTPRVVGLEPRKNLGAEGAAK